jgi:glycosyltransferase involved in cell wall biosynthesis
LAKPLSIVHIARSPVGGVFRHIADLVSAQTAAGHRVGLICDSTDGGALEDARIAALSSDLELGCVRLPMRRSISPADLPAVLAVASHTARMRPHVIHAHGAKGGFFGRLAAFIERRRGRTVAAFYNPHGGSLHYDSASVAGRLYFGVERGLERLTDALIHVSAYEAATYREKVGVPLCPAHVVLNGLRPEEFEPIIQKADAADFLFIGTLRDLKGVDVYLRALGIVKERGRPFRAVIVGAGEPGDEERYREIAAGAGLTDAVTFLSPMPAREAFALGRTVVIPSRAESMPYIVLETVAAGLPIITTAVGGIPEILEGDSAQLLPPGDPAALADAMAMALRTPERMAAEATLRRDRIRHKFSLEGMARQVEDIYRGALDRRIAEISASPAMEADFSR